ncbi:zinc-binding dehydrogenase [Microbacterium sp. KR10-403]|uniref:zinc-dependent alcohol dehydrogenase n=1 Tax=Microbacterium sp. KR10-403 TaxID=3158581 RepID=UPI0032E43FFA
MRALVLEDFGRLVVAERDDPTPAPDEVTIRIIATGICGSDIHGYTGENGRRVPGQIMGHETVGVVEALGASVARADLRPGVTVTVNPVILPPEDLDEYAGREQHDPGKRVLGVAPELVSAFAEKIVAPARNVHVLPPTMPALYGALIEPLAVAVNAVRRSGAAPGDAVFVAGGGPIGQSVVLALQMAGITEVIVSEVAPERRDLVEQLGAIVIDPADGAASEAVMTAFGRAADVAIDAVGITETLRGALESTRLGGTVCLVGMGSPLLSLDAFAVSTAERTIVGSFTYTDADFAAAVAWMSQGPAAADALISECVGIDGADAAFGRLCGGGGVPGKILIVLDPAHLSGHTGSTTR